MTWQHEPVMARRRRIAVCESRALRAYLRATGRYPRHAPTDWTIT